MCACMHVCVCMFVCMWLIVSMCPRIHARTLPFYLLLLHGIDFPGAVGRFVRLLKPMPLPLPPLPLPLPLPLPPPLPPPPPVTTRVASKQTKLTRRRLGNVQCLGSSAAAQTNFQSGLVKSSTA